MRRFEALTEIVGCLTDQLVVCNIGQPSQELFAIGDRPENFYMLGSMGLASSIGLGLAMSSPRRVVVLDGDGAATMNMGGFATIGHARPPNLMHVIIDNEANGSTGFQPSFTAGRLALDAVARGCGIESVHRVTRQAEIAPAFRALDNEPGPHVLIVKTAPGMPDGIGIIPLTGLDIRARFMAAMQ